MIRAPITCSQLSLLVTLVLLCSYMGTNPSPVGFQAVIMLNGTTWGEDLATFAQLVSVGFVKTKQATYIQSGYDGVGQLWRKGEGYE